MGRLQLQQQLRTLANKAWYQKPDNKDMTYPCFVYKAMEPAQVFANNKSYLTIPRYEILYISKTEDDGIWQRMIDTFGNIEIGKKYVSDNLYHYVFHLYYQ